jgi:8-oxo-dGTP diphosphatase
MEESPRLALAREVFEELALTLDPETMRPLGFADERAEGDRSAIVLFLYDCAEWRGTAMAMEGQAFGWFTLRKARSLPLAGMDRILLESLVDPRS